MSTEQYDYPEDEFDVAGRDRGPHGAHRTPRPLWRTLLPFLVVLVAAPLLAWGLVTLIGGQDEPDPQATTQATEEPAEEEPAEEEPTEEPTEEEPTEEPTDEPTDDNGDEPGEVDLTASIAVLNGTGMDGLAGEVADAIGEQGFSQVSPSNYESALPEDTTLYYNNASLAATAEAVGEAAGITNLQELPSATQNVDIAIVLRSDYDG